MGRLQCRSAVALTMTFTLSGLVATTLAPTPPGRQVATEPAPARASDRFGNEISPAVATYKLDTTGLLYEEHSPQTELPQLGVPRS